MNTKEIGERIDAHLKRMEADPAINTPIGSLHRFYQSSANGSGAWVIVCYVSFQGQRALRKTEAEKYLAALDAGYNGTHCGAKP